MSRPRPLTPQEAKHSLAQRLAKPVDRIRQIATRLGAHSKRVFLVWTKYTGEERGDGVEREVFRMELLPTPRVSDLSSTTRAPFSGGILPIGSIKVDLISAQLPFEVLVGKRRPAAPGLGEEIEQPYDFFYELVEDHRVSPEPARLKYRILGTPNRNETNVCWEVMLERESEDRAPDGRSLYGVA